MTECKFDCDFKKYRKDVVLKKDLVDYVKLGFKMNWILVITVSVMAVIEIGIAFLLVFG